MARKRQPKKVEVEEGKLALRGLRLMESLCQLGQLKPDDLPGHAAHGLHADIAIDDAEKLAYVHARFHLESRYEKEQKEPTILIDAAFGVGFAIVEKFPKRQNLEGFLELLAIRTLWPYWREFVQSITTRMGLPAFPIPVVYVNEMIRAAKKNKKQIGKPSSASATSPAPPSSPPR